VLRADDTSREDEDASVSGSYRRLPSYQVDPKGGSRSKMGCDRSLYGEGHEYLGGVTCDAGSAPQCPKVVP
jgi:hypothetical protein